MISIDEHSDVLYIRIGEKQFLFACYDSAHPKTLQYASFPINPDISVNANMHRALNLVPLCKTVVGEVYVSVEGDFTPQPLEEFEEEDMDTIYFFNNPDQQERKRVHYEVLPHSNIVLLYTVDKDLEHTLRESFAKISFHCAELSPLLFSMRIGGATPFASPTNEESTNYIVAYATTTRLTVACFRQSALSLLNTFKVSQPADAAYCLVAMAKEWPMNPQCDDLNLVGDEQICLDIQKQLSGYFPLVKYHEASALLDKKIQPLQGVMPFDFLCLLFGERMKSNAL